MTSLTYTAYVTRNFVKYGGIGVGIFTIFYMSMAAGIAAWKLAHPVKVPPDLKYGILPKIVFPEKEFVKKNFTQQLANDSLPVFKDQARVYFVARPNTSIMALEENNKTAKQLGFNAGSTDIGKGIYEYKNDILNQTLTMNVIDGSFKMKYPYESDQLLLNPDKVPNKNEAIDLAKSYLSTGEKYAKDLEEGEKKVSYWKIELDGLKAVTSQSEGNAARVDFFRSNLEDELPIVSSEYNRAPVSILVSGSSSDGKRIVEVDYHYAAVDRELFATYPTKTAEEAWAELAAGNYWPVNEVAGDKINIKKMYLAYFEPVVLTNYLLPVYVFEGDNKFVAYVPAVTDQWVK